MSIVRFVHLVHFRLRRSFRRARAARATVAILCTLAFAGLSRAADVVDARAALARFRAEQEILSDAFARNDEAALHEHQPKAQAALEEARKLFDGSDASASEDPATLRDYAEILTRMGDADLAAEVLQRAAERVSDDAQIQRALGQALGELGPKRNGDAIRALHRSLDIEPASPGAANALALLADLYRDAGLYDLARESAEAALVIAPDHPGAGIALACLDFRHGDVAKASDALDALGPIPPAYGRIFNAWIQDGARGFDFGRRFFPDTAENHLAYAKLLLRAGRIEDARDATERSVALAPGNFVAWNLIGDLRRENGDTEAARAAYERSLELNPDQPRTREFIEALSKPDPAAPSPGNPK